MFLEIRGANGLPDTLNSDQPYPVRVVIPYMRVYTVFNTVQGEYQRVVFHCNLSREYRVVQPPFLRQTREERLALWLTAAI